MASYVLELDRQMTAMAPHKSGFMSMKEPVLRRGDFGENPACPECAGLGAWISKMVTDQSSYFISVLQLAAS
ncbi:MAG: hypothetical protein COY49_05485 [Comamonadaceae bacterium CG_4_10_14_0_8_um_filter_57_29]|nr:MAG: hypothetical protein COY49_05485 [Comamonadaceae bacterium CG_4_10_14_0_8_um_filter_57_29]